MAKKKIECYLCGNTVDKDVAALNKKTINREIARFLCKACLAESIECSQADLDVLIEEFKQQGCVLFI